MLVAGGDMTYYDESMKFFSDIQWSKLLFASFAAIIIAMPFHGFIGVVLGEYVLSAEIAKAWKEILLSIICLATIADMLSHRKQLQAYLKDRLTQLIIVYGVIHVAMALFVSGDFGSAVVGLLLNLRLLALFVSVSWWRRRKLINTDQAGWIARALMIAIFATTIFGMLQILVLPADFLTNFGYGAGTIEPTFTLDDNEGLIRVASFTRGPNVFAAMLVVYCVFILERVLHWVSKGPRIKSWMHAPQLFVLVAGLVFSVFFSYSRSGWIAITVALAVYGLIRLPKKYYARAVGLASLATVVVGVLIVMGVGRFDALQTLILHDNPNSGQISSTNLHFEANERAFNQVKQDPIGEGPGSAGPASAYADSGVNIAENYYLQIAQEVGWVGLIVFLMIFVTVVSRLLRVGDVGWPAITATAMIGVAAAAMFAHSWADEEVALTLWGLAGLYIPQKSHL
jgi:hypothetical protein